MKKKIIRKFTALMTAIISLSATVSIPVSAINATNNIIDTKLNYAETALATYLNSYGMSGSDFYLSSAYDVYDMESGTAQNEVYIAFDNEDVIGMLSITEVNGEYYSSFELNNFDTLQNLYDNDTRFNFVCNDECLYIHNGIDTYSIDDDSITVEYNFSTTSAEVLEKRNAVNVTSSKTRVHNYKKNLIVPIVQNESMNGRGLCWAAAIASRSDYIGGSTYVAHDIYYILNGIYSGTPIGTPLWIQRGYQYFQYSCTRADRMLNCIEIMNNIEINNPIHIDLYTSDASVGHSVLISGLTINSDGTGIYRLVDSNKMAYVDVMVPADVMTGENDFVYATTYGYIFENCWYSYY